MPDNAVKYMAKSSTSYRKGESGNPSGRPKHALNHINSEGRKFMHSFFTSKFPEAEKKFSQLSDYQQWMVLLRIAEFIYPKQRAITLDADINMMSDEQAKEILAELMEKHLWNQKKL